MDSILIVEADAALGRNWRREFEALGWRAHVVADASTALRVVKTEPYRCLLLDLGLDGQAGLTVLRGLSAARYEGSIIVAATDAPTATIVEAMRLGAVSVVNMPASAVDILAALPSADSPRSRGGAQAPGAASRRPAASPRRLTRLLIVDDHAVVRDGLKELFSREPDLQVVGEARSVEEAFERCRAVAPDLALVDLSLGQQSGLLLIAGLRAALPALRILVLSMHDERIFAQRALRAGANGYIGKNEDSDEILRAVRRLIQGRTFVSDAVNERLVASLASNAGATDLRGLSQLSNRELEVLRLIGSGLKTGDLASRLGVSAKTIETHRARIKDKLGLESAGELVIFAANWVRDGFPARTGDERR